MSRCPIFTLGDNYCSYLLFVIYCESLTFFSLNIILLGSIIVDVLYWCSLPPFWYVKLSMLSFILTALVPPIPTFLSIYYKLIFLCIPFFSLLCLAFLSLVNEHIVFHPDSWVGNFFTVQISCHRNTILILLIQNL